MKGIRTAALAALLLAAPVAADDNLGEILGGSRFPHALKLKELGAGWKRVTIGSGEARNPMGDLMKNILPMAMMGAGKGPGGGGGEKKPDDAMGAILGMQVLSALFGGGGGGSEGGITYYTRGQTATLGAETFLVAYQIDRQTPPGPPMPAGDGAAKEPDFGALFGGAKLTEESPLTLTLLNLRNVGTLSHIRPFDLQRELTEAPGPGGGLGGLFQGMMGAGTGGPGGSSSAPVVGPEARVAPIPTRRRAPARRAAPARRPATRKP